MSRGPLLIVGASGRAAAASAIRAGFEPHVIDLFADADTQRLALTLKCERKDYPHGFVELAKQVPPMPWMYTGGLENYPDVIDTISVTRRLMGNHSRSLNSVRNPYIWSAILQAHDLPAADVLPVPTWTGNWLRKQFRSAGGTGVSRHVNFAKEQMRCDYLQRFVPGKSYSALYVSSIYRCHFLGYCQQLIGEPAFHAKPFAYCGNIGPINRPLQLATHVKNLGSLATNYGLRNGLFGIDFILHNHLPFAVDVNPRFTASVELYEFSRRKSYFNWHDIMSQPYNPASEEESEDEEIIDEEDREPPEWNQPGTLQSKAIYYAANSFTFPACGPWEDSLARCTEIWHRPDYADIPLPGTAIETGDPVLTIFASEPTAKACLIMLKAHAAELDRLFGVSP